MGIKQESVVIAESGTISSALNLNYRSPVTIEFPEMTGTSVAVHGKNNTGTFEALYDQDGVAIAFATPSNKLFTLNPTKIFGQSEIKFVSNDTEVAARTIYVRTDSYVD